MGPGTTGRLAGPASLVAVHDVAAERDLWCYHDAGGKLRQLLDVDVVSDPNYPKNPNEPDGLVAYYDYEGAPEKSATNPCDDGQAHFLNGCDVCGECFEGYLWRPHYPDGDVDRAMRLRPDRRRPERRRRRRLQPRTADGWGEGQVRRAGGRGLLLHRATDVWSQQPADRWADHSANVATDGG